MIECQFCGSENEGWYVYCQNCGKKLAPQKVSEEVGEETSDDLTEALTTGHPAAATTGERYREPLPVEQSTLAISDPDLSAPVPPVQAETPPLASNVPTAASIVGPGSPAKEAPSVPTVTCLRCQQPVPEIYAFCGYCGIRLGLSQEEPPQSTKDPLRAETAARQGRSPAVAMVVRVREDGTLESGFCVREGEMILGRESGDVTFPSDALMSKRHVRITAAEGKLHLKDLGSTNGTFLRLRKKTPLTSGDYLLIGKQLLRFESEAADAGGAPSADQTVVLGSLVGEYEAKLVKRLPNGRDSNEYPLTESVTVIGREKGDLLFKIDPYVSAMHAKIHQEGGGYSIEDLKSSNGTYLRLRQEEEILPEDFFIVGEQLFQVRLVTSQ